MTLKEFRELTKHLPGDLVIINQKDPEGNGYSPLSNIRTDGIYVPKNTWSGDVYSDTWTADDVCLEEDEWKKLKSKPRCLTVVPIN